MHFLLSAADTTHHTRKPRVLSRQQACHSSPFQGKRKKREEDRKEGEKKRSRQSRKDKDEERTETPRKSEREQREEEYETKGRLEVSS